MSTQVQFCCGSNLLPGFKNHDRDCDVTQPLPYPDACTDLVFCEHGFEHFDSGDGLRFLTECHRILKPGAILRLCCPVVGPWLDRDHARDLATGHGHRVLLTEETMRTFLWMAGFELDQIQRTDRREMDGHHRVIGIEKDNIETCRMQAIKT